MIDPIYLSAMGFEKEKLTKGDMKRLREAYKRAHDIRKFEIEMYWRRSAYLWAFQAVAFAALGAIFASTNNIGWECPEIPSGNFDICATKRSRLIIATAVWSFGLVTSIVWVMLLQGAKFWQNNWERHVDYLEAQFSGHLYKTYPTEDSTAPYSVSKLNRLVATCTVFLWLTIGISIGSLMIKAHWCLVAIALISLVFLPYWFFEKYLRMDPYGRKPTEGKTQRGHWMLRR